MNASSQITMSTLQQVKDSYRMFLQTETDAVLLLDDTIVDCNEQVCELLRYPPEALLGRQLHELSPPTQPDGMASPLAAQQRISAMRHGLPQACEWRFLTSDGDTRDVLLGLETARFGSEERVRVTLRDITPLKRAESALRESETRLQQILDNTTAVVYVKDRAGRYLLVNRHHLRVFGLRESDVLGRTDRDLFPSDIARTYRQNDLLVLERNGPVEIEETAPLEDGLHTYISIKFPLYDATGEANAVCGISTDITARKRIEEALRNAALGVSGARGDDLFPELVRYLATTLEVEIAFISQFATDGADALDTVALCAGGRIIDNIRYSLLGTPCETVVGRTFRYYARDLQKLFPNDEMATALGLNSYAGYPLFAASGEPTGLIAVMDRKPLADPEVTESMLRIFAERASTEIERRQAEQALRTSEEQYRSIFSASVDGLALWDPDGRMVDANPAFWKMHGYSRSELLSLEPRQFVHADFYPRFEQFLRTFDSGQPFHTEARDVRKDGSEFDVEVHGVLTQYRGHTHLLSIVRNITQRKQAEYDRVRLEAQLRQAQKMEAIGHLTGGIAHDFNNILSSIMGYVVLAIERQAQLGDEKLANYLERANHSAQRARDLIQQMLTFSRGQRGEAMTLSLPPLVKESVKLLSSTLPSTVEMRMELDADLSPVRMDPVHIEQVLMNLCINARDAMAGSGNITVKLRQAEDLCAVCSSCQQPLQGNFVELAVHDTGPGIAPAILERMFEPFFTTKQKGKGSGMGLSTVHGIIHEHRGHIVVDTAPGEGAAFRILLPPDDRNGTSETAAAIDVLHSERSRTLAGHVMVVDDDESVGELMQDLLETWGLRVTLTTSSLDAQTAFVRDPRQFDLVVTDHLMPGMTGLVLAQRFLNIRPDLPVILYTGFSDGRTEQQIEASGIRALLKKPVDFDELFIHVEEALRK